MTNDLPGTTLNPFPIPSGPLGRMADWVMARDDSAQRRCGALPAEPDRTAQHVMRNLLTSIRGPIGLARPGAEWKCDERALRTGMIVFV